MQLTEPLWNGLSGGRHGIGQRVGHTTVKLCTAMPHTPQTTDKARSSKLWAGKIKSVRAKGANHKTGKVPPYLDHVPREQWQFWKLEENAVPHFHFCLFDVRDRLVVAAAHTVCTLGRGSTAGSLQNTQLFEPWQKVGHGLHRMQYK